MAQRKSAAEELQLDLSEMRRNPYLADYGRERGRHGYTVVPGGRSAERAGAYERPRRAQSTGRAGAYERPRRAQTARDERSRRMAARERARRRKVRAQRRLMALGCMVGACLVLLLGLRLVGFFKTAEGTKGLPDSMSGFLEHLGEERVQGIPVSLFNTHPEWTEDFLTVNEYSRPGETLPEVKNVFVHYTANPGTSAAQNRSYFEQLKDTHERSASAHFIIGYEGEILQCIPLNEIAYAVQTRNYDSVSIECCYQAEDGSFTQETYDSLIALLKWLTDTYGLDAEDILRHYDCGGKKCPLYYTEHPDAWEQLLRDVDNL